jgi:hypothetical protein
MFPSFSNSYSHAKPRPPDRIMSHKTLNLSGINVINSSPFRTSGISKFVNMNNYNTALNGASSYPSARSLKSSVPDYYQKDSVANNLNSIENKLNRISEEVDTRTQLLNNLYNKSDKNIGIYNPFIGNPIIGTDPNASNADNSFSTPKKTQPKFEPTFKNTNPRLESLEYQQFIQEQLIQQRKEKLQENNFQLNNLIFQEIDEMGDKLELFKVEMFNHIKKLERRQEKTNFNELIDEIDHVKDYFKREFTRSEKRRDRDLEEMRENLNILKDELNDNFKNETKKNRSMMKAYTDEVREQQEEVNERINELDENSRYRMNSLKRSMRRLREDLNYGFDNSDGRGSGRRSKDYSQEEESDFVPRNYNDEEIDEAIKKKGLDKKRTQTMKNEDELREFIEKYKIKNSIAEQEANEETDDDNVNPNDLTNLDQKFKAKKQLEKKKTALNLGIGNFTELTNFK